MKFRKLDHHNSANTLSALLDALELVKNQAKSFLDVDLGLLDVLELVLVGLAHAPERIGHTGRGGRRVRLVEPQCPWA